MRRLSTIVSSISLLLVSSTALITGENTLPERVSAASPPSSVPIRISLPACAVGFVRFLGRCEKGDTHRTEPVINLVAGGRALYELENSAIVFRSVYEYGDASPGANCAYGANIRANRAAWMLEEQRAGGLDVIAGALRHDPRLIRTGLCMFRFGLDRQAANGSFPGSAWPFHGTAMFMSETGPALLVLRNSRYAGQFRSDIDADAAQMQRAASYMVRYVHGPSHIDDISKNHRLFEAAIALGSIGVLTHDGTLVRWSETYARRGIRMEWRSGIMPENGGHDSGYQALGMVNAERYFVLAATGQLRQSLYAALQKGESWELSRIKPDGSINQTGDTRTAGCRETVPSGGCKTAFYVPVVAAFSRWAGITGDQRFAQAALRVHEHGQ